MGSWFRDRLRLSFLKAFACRGIHMAGEGAAMLVKKMIFFFEEFGSLNIFVLEKVLFCF